MSFGNGGPAGPAALEGLPLGGFALSVKTRSLSIREQAYFEVYLAEARGEAAGRRWGPVFYGVHSRGREAWGIKGWVDGEFVDEVTLQDEEASLSRRGLDVPLFRALGRLVPPGGSLMVAYVMFRGESEVHMATKAALERGIPPAATPLGYLLLEAGCAAFRDWYIPEGGREGPQKLQGFKPLNRSDEAAKVQALLRELERFLEKFASQGLPTGSPEEKAVKLAGRARALLKGRPPSNPQPTP